MTTKEPPSEPNAVIQEEMEEFDGFIVEKRSKHDGRSEAGNVEHLWRTLCWILLLTVCREPTTQNPLLWIDNSFQQKIEESSAEALRPTKL